MLAGTVDALEWLFMLQANQAMTGCDRGCIFSIVSRFSSIARFELVNSGRKLVLCRGDLVVLGFCRNAQRPQVVIDFLHEFVDGRSDGAEVMLFKLLALEAEQRRTGCGPS